MMEMCTWTGHYHHWKLLTVLCKELKLLVKQVRLSNRNHWKTGESSQSFLLTLVINPWCDQRTHIHWEYLAPRMGRRPLHWISGGQSKFKLGKEIVRLSARSPHTGGAKHRTAIISTVLLLQVPILWKKNQTTPLLLSESMKGKNFVYFRHIFWKAEYFWLEDNLHLYIQDALACFPLVFQVVAMYWFSKKTCCPRGN